LKRSQARRTRVPISNSSKASAMSTISRACPVKGTSEPAPTAAAMKPASV